MRIIFIGTVEFSYKALEKLINLNANIVGVCTKENSHFNADYVSLKPLCIKNNIEYKFVNDINNKENLEWIKSKKPDIIFCFGWSSLIKKELLQIPPMGILGFHPAKLPHNRGRHPIIWALALGLKKSASTFFFMDEGADSGDILSQKEFEILYEDNANSLYKKIINIALLQIEEFLPQLQNNNYKKIKQNHKIANYWRKRGKTDGKIDFRMDSFTIYNLVRALAKPYIGAHIEYAGKDIKIWKVKEHKNIVSIEYFENIEYGKVLKIENDSIFVRCYNGIIEIIKHEFTIMPSKGEYL
jgi:methionyl-tRNA formyltransferase